jgi:hypothetical protein
MALSKVDFTIFFRSLSSAASQVDSNDALMVLEPAFYEACFSLKVSDKEWGYCCGCMYTCDCVCLQYLERCTTVERILRIRRGLVLV